MRGKVVSENAYALIISIFKNVEPEAALKEMKIKSRPRPYERLGVKLKDSDREKVYEQYYKENLSLSDIGKFYNVSRWTVKNYMDKVGIPTKPKGPYKKNEQR